METRYVVSSQTSLLVETEKQVRLQAIVNVDGGGTPIESIRVLLPHSAQLLPSSTGEFIVEEAEATEASE